MEEHLDSDGVIQQTNEYQPLENPRDLNSAKLTIHIDRVTGTYNLPLFIVRNEDLRSLTAGFQIRTGVSEPMSSLISSFLSVVIVKILSLFSMLIQYQDIYTMFVYIPEFYIIIDNVSCK